MTKQIPVRFKPQEFETKWQETWEKQGIYSPDIERARKPYYNLMMFPYPSAEGLHVGNMYAFTGVDVYGRFMRMHGYDVFEPIGLDGFGIHSENYALKVNRHPKQQAKISEANFYRQLRAIGNGFDWRRTLETYDPEYYRWTQWLFVEMFKHGLAYRAIAVVNWCPGCKTVLADEQVIAEKCERCSSVVEKKDLEQWFFRITAYADRLLQNTYKPSFKWSEKVKIGQQNWIGKKEGVVITYQITTNEPKNTTKHHYEVECFTTRPDTNFGATFVVIAPEHPLILKITNNSQLQKVKKYIESTKRKSKNDRVAEGRRKTGVFTGAYAVNNLTGTEMPVWVSDFVLMDVGTGAVVGVPGHDLRDFEFAQEFKLPIKRVVVGSDGDTSEITKAAQVQEAAGRMINSEFLDGLEIMAAKEKIIEYLVAKGLGVRSNHYHLRDWLISRQRYWGAPIPMVYCEACASEGKSWFTLNPGAELGPLAKLSRSSRDDESWAIGWYPIDEAKLPVLLPDVEDWRPTGTGRGPLAGVPAFYETTCPHCGSPARQETDVCDTFLDSSWYFLRYPMINSPRSAEKAITPEVSKHWLPVDSYIGGAEHTVLHLLYARFVWMAMRDWNYLPLTDERETEAYNPEEPFKRFFAHGLIIKDGAKMSKSKGNVVVPDEYIKLYGADTLRTYLMFLGPFEGGGDFRDTGIAGMYRWLSRVWRLIHDSANKWQINHPKANTDAEKMIHLTIREVSEDIQQLHYNTAIAKLMECVNWWMDHSAEIDKEFVKRFLLLLAPFAPYMTEELYATYFSEEGEKGNTLDSIHLHPWPTFDESLLVEEHRQMIIQVNGKTREVIRVEASKANNQDQVEQLAKASARVSRELENKSVGKIIFVPGKLINFVT